MLQQKTRFKNNSIKQKLNEVPNIMNYEVTRYGTPELDVVVKRSREEKDVLHS
jgi:hypothetical protein